jgi:RNA polymerase sigma factor (sigma-70 family)
MHDSQLLEEYVSRNSETAFQSLVNRYLNLVRSTALRQVRNAPLAEEVAQAVFILLARKAALLRQSKNLVLGGWLYRTTCFVAARAARGEMRRQRREQEAFQMQQLSSADETWRRIAPLLDEGIEQLNPSDRDAIILRFFQGEPLRSVGGALGISEDAAKKRVSRSLEKLRAFFIRRGFTISTAVLATALAGQHAEAAPAGLAGAIGARALAHAGSATATLPALVAGTLRAWQWATVKIMAGIGAAATAVIVLTAHALTFSPPPGGPAVDAPVAKLAPSASLSARQRTSATKSAANEPWRFLFQAVDAETGMGIAKARIMVVSVKDKNQALARPQQVDLQTNLVTDAEGRCDIALPYSNPLMLMVGVLAEGYTERCFAAGLDHPVPDSYVLKVSRGSRIGGVVQYESGQPIAGAGIKITFYGTGDSSDREFQSERPGFPSDDVVVTTDSTGHWTFGSAPTNGEFRLAVIHAGFPPADFQNDDDARSSPDAATLQLADLRDGKAVLVLKAGLTLRGVVTDEYGYHVAGAKVGLGRFFPESHTMATESDGSFVLAALPPGENFVTITADGFAPQRIEVQMASNTAPLAVQLKPGAILRLRVLDQTGSPMPKARVEVDGWQGPNTLEWGGLTDSSGRILWNSAPLEPITLSVLKDGYFNWRQNTLTANGQEHTITLRPQLTVVGRVSDAETKQPLASFKAIPGSDRSDTAYGANGQYKLNFTELSQPLTLSVEADGYEPATSQPLDASAAHLTCDFELKKQKREDAILGVVLLPDGTAAAGVQVALAAARAVEMGKAKFLNSRDSATTQTDADGHFSFAAGLAARAVMAVHQEGFGSVSITGAHHMVSIQLQPWGRIEGVLRLTTKPNAGQEILLAAPPGPGLEETLSLNLDVYTTKTDEQGNFAFDQAPPGPFNLYLVKLNESYSHQTPVQVPPGATAVVQIGGTGDIIAGRLVMSNPSQTIDWSKRLLIPMLQTKLPYPPGISGLARAQWYGKYAKSEDGRARIRAACSYPLDVRTDGTFTVEGVPPGDYELTGKLSDSTIHLSEGILGHTIGSFRQDVTVPQLAEGQSTEKIDLGAVRVEAGNP